MATPPIDLDDGDYVIAKKLLHAGTIDFNRL